MKSRHTKPDHAHRFKERVQSWTTKLRVNPKQIRLQKMNRKWASCSTLGWVTFSEDLLNEPPAFQDYVIVHELLHLKVRNHGKLFKSFMRAYLPGWEKRDTQLLQRGTCELNSGGGSTATLQGA
ncbi:MAG TPA: M48 family metallopeptidase [Terracidiphilus sp.]|nr:M48 family metallopeptidase [Terracidiphilus sp.]